LNLNWPCYACYAANGYRLLAGEFCIVTSAVKSKAALRSSSLRSPRTFLPTSTSVFLRIPLCSFPHPFPAISIPTQAQNLKSLLQASILPKSVKMKSAIMLAVGAFAFAVSAQTTALPACGVCYIYPFPSPFPLRGPFYLSAQAPLMSNRICCAKVSSNRCSMADSPPVVPLLQQHARKGWGA